MNGRLEKCSVWFAVVDGPIVAWIPKLDVCIYLDNNINLNIPNDDCVYLWTCCTLEQKRYINVAVLSDLSPWIFVKYVIFMLT